MNVASECTIRFGTQTVSIADTVNEGWRFVIPPYQRPYVWGDVQIKKLLADFKLAQAVDADKDYFIGTILIYKSETNKHIYQLVDGQQRFTTLWLLSAALRNLKIRSEMDAFLLVDSEETRLDFTIRKQITQYFTSLAIEGKSVFAEDQIRNDEYLQHIAEAVTTIYGVLSENPRNLDSQSYKKELTEFANYVYKHARMVANVIPENTDLNKLFASVNNNGVQLEQSDILKSLLLKKITTGKAVFSRLWETCEHMDNYVERNYRSLFPSVRIDTYDGLMNTPPDDCSLDSDVTVEHEQPESYTIGDILAGQAKGTIDDVKHESEYADDEENGTSTVVTCRSIVSFPELLLHTYRIYLKAKGQSDFTSPFTEKHLLFIFSPLYQQSEDDIKMFFKCLWRVRFAFDKWILKWIAYEEKEEALTLTSVSMNNDGRGTRVPAECSDDLMLQSLMYYTSGYGTQYWVAPFLNRMMDGGDSDCKSLHWLERIDNELSLSQMSARETSWLMMDSSVPPGQTVKFDYVSYLRGTCGTGFRHYWFQKLEYVLWKHGQADKSTDSRFNSYRIRSRNSVEHVFPQHPEAGDTLPNDLLNNFGNLALLSVAQNSSYSNQVVAKKRVDFYTGNKPYHSLKLKDLYEPLGIIPIDIFEIKKILDLHREAMITVLQSHYDSYQPQPTTTEPQP